tara:strand:- start:12232 stop:15372 length:3141 start_codon:yes stop_codon:yes gene_type:complete
MRFAHISDTHIRNLKYHFEYREVFKQIYSYLKENNIDYIVHCGDIAHTKTQISPEFVEMATDFFRSLANIAPTYVILGNHDGNLRNSSRQDALTPIVDALGHENLFLIKNSSIVDLKDNFALNILSVFDEDNWKTPDPNKINIALYHGSILNCQTDTNWVMDSTDHTIDIFDGCDYAFLGDIHKAQSLDEKGKIRYAGSTVQQNFGESLDKGLLLWDIEDKDTFTCEYITFDNPKPFVTVPLTKKGNLPKKLNIPEGARVRLVSENSISLDKMRRAVDIVKFKYTPDSVTYLNRAASKKLSLENSAESAQKDLRDIKVQEELIKEYLKEYEASDSVMKKVLELNQKFNTLIEQKEDTFRNINWSLKKMEWDNLFNYAEDNVIDFTKLNGVVGIFGKNFSGKSSIIDSLLYTVYNSSSKSIRKNLNMINQNKQDCVGTVTITIDDKDYEISRTSEKYTKKLKGEETLEAKTDVEFSMKDLIGNVTSLNGTSRQDTDKNIRKYFGTIDDFLMTSMASQLDSLSFINEGSTKRKEILAKFLDLEIFDKKFKMAKESGSDAKSAFQKLKDINFSEIEEDIKSRIFKSEIQIAENKALHASISEETLKLKEDLNAVQQKINSAPTEVVDICALTDNIQKAKTLVFELETKITEVQSQIETDTILFEKIENFMKTFDVEKYTEDKKLFQEKDSLLKEFLQKMRKESENITTYRKRESLLSEVPCGSEYSHCKFIKDAYESIDLIAISEKSVKEYSNKTNQLGEEIRELNYQKIEEYLAKYQKVLDKKNKTATNIAQNKINIERYKTEVFKNKSLLEDLLSKQEDYNKNKEVIENLEKLISQRNALKKDINNKEKESEKCNEVLMELYKTNGSLEEKLSANSEKKKEYEKCKVDFAAYDLLMTCCHPNGISYDIIKERLPIINQEIAKMLTNIVEFEIFIKNEDKKLDIFIKHPKHDPRPLEMGSGAEKTIASMAIRLAFLTVTSLPKSDLFILDEPGTALDEENMEGFVRILDMIKNYFKTVILISHLDSLKDCVDMQINIEKQDGYAKVRI